MFAQGRSKDKKDISVVKDEQYVFLPAVGVLQDVSGQHLPDAAEQIGFAAGSVIKLEQLAEGAYEARIAEMAPDLKSWSTITVDWGVKTQVKYSRKNLIKLDDIRKAIALIAVGRHYVQGKEARRLQTASFDVQRLLAKFAESRARDF